MPDDAKERRSKAFRPRFACWARYFCQTIQKYPKNLYAREGAGLRPVPPDQVRGRLCDARSRRGPQNSLRPLRSLRSDMLWPFFRLALHVLLGTTARLLCFAKPPCGLNRHFSAPSRAKAKSTADGASRCSLLLSEPTVSASGEYVGLGQPERCRAATRAIGTTGLGLCGFDVRASKAPSIAGPGGDKGACV